MKREKYHNEKQFDSEISNFLWWQDFLSKVRIVSGEDEITKNIFSLYFSVFCEQLDRKIRHKRYFCAKCERRQNDYAPTVIVPAVSHISFLSSRSNVIIWPRAPCLLAVFTKLRLFEWFKPTIPQQNHRISPINPATTWLFNMRRQNSEFRLVFRTF